MDFNKLMQLSVDLICTVDHKDRFVEVSAASYTILGYDPIEMCGRTYMEFIHPADLETAEQAVTSIMTKRPDTQIQIRYLHKNGSIVPLLWCVQWDEDDQLMYCIARSGLITEQTELMRSSLEESNRRYQYVTQATSDAIWDWDLVHGTLYWGEGHETIFGYNRKNLPIGIDTWTQHIHPDDREFVIRSIVDTCTSSDTTWKEEYRYKKADGTYADVVDRGFVLRDEAGLAIRMVGAMHDISERKKTIYEMHQVTADLFKQNRELHEFGYIVSHNLRAPVANIKGIAELMKIEEGDSDHSSPYLINLITSISKLDEVIIDLSKILSSKNRTIELKHELLDVREIINNILIDLSENIEKCHAGITITGGPFMISSYKAYLNSIFFNLISNSIKYKLEHPPSIVINFAQTDKEVIISYSDNSSGIDLKRFKDDIFKPYKAFHSTIRGKGLGLFLVKSYIEALGGSIDVNSEPGLGVAYRIILLKPF
jgi:PAS domain S-box-containing protein